VSTGSALPDHMAAIVTRVRARRSLAENHVPADVSDVHARSCAAARSGRMVGVMPTR
jgi:hypothetical protein